MAGKLVKAVQRGQRGMATAEYAVGSVAVATGVGVLITLLNQPWFQELVINFIRLIFQLLQAILGAK